MVVGQSQDNKTNKFNPLIDTGNTTVNAFNAIRNKEKSDSNFILGRDDKTSFNSPNFKVKVKAWTQVDDKTHTYFHSLSIDVNVEDFMGTAELKCPYDSDLMAYWEPIRQTVVIYGSNRGDYKILFIGRVRGVKQDGYELVVEFQNYGWKFKQLVSQSYANDNVLNKDGYTIMRLMFEALKIDSWVISESAKNRLKEVGINSDGNLTLNGEEVKEMPDLLKRLQASDPSKLVSKDTLNDKLREKYLHNIDNINYTLKYEEPSPVMKKISSEGSYTSGSNVYENAYSSANGNSTTGGGNNSGINMSNSEYSMVNRANANSTGCSAPSTICPDIPTTLKDAITVIYLYNRSCYNSIGNACGKIKNFADNYPYIYSRDVDKCLVTMGKYTNRKDGGNAASYCRQDTSQNTKNRTIRGSIASYNSTRSGTNYVATAARARSGR